MEKISKLAQVRKSKGLTQEKLSELSGIHRVLIARYESGNIKPSVDSLVKLAGALHVPVDDLIEKAG